jgi:hypothetical protein
MTSDLNITLFLAVLMTKERFYLIKFAETVSQPFALIQILSFSLKN